ncbi:hypothetical protein ACSVDA_21270 [Cytobacillus sp. Hm23]
MWLLTEKVEVDSKDGNKMLSVSDIKEKIKRFKGGKEEAEKR